MFSKDNFNFNLKIHRVNNQVKSSNGHHMTSALLTETFKDNAHCNTIIFLHLNCITDKRFGK